MMRTILKPDKSQLILELPIDLVGKTIEILAFSVEEDQQPAANNLSSADNVTVLKKKLNKFSINSGGYKFDRGEANEYE